MRFWAIRSSARSAPICRELHIGQIVLEGIDRLEADGVPTAPMVMDAGYGITTELRDEFVGTQPRICGRRSGRGEGVARRREAGALPSRTGDKGDRRGCCVAHLKAKPVTLATLALQSAQDRVAFDSLARGYRKATCVRASRGYVCAPRIATIGAASRGPRSGCSSSGQLVGRDRRSIGCRTSPPTSTLTDLVHLAKIRWRIERDYQELKDEIGIDHYEGRGWLAFTITGPYVSTPAPSWQPSELGFPPRRL